MNWYYSIEGGHTHVRVFMNGGKCGDLVFRNEEFTEVMANEEGRPRAIINFIDENDPDPDGEADAT